MYQVRMRAQRSGMPGAKEVLLSFLNYTLRLEPLAGSVVAS
jgi:hypothetical protein